jgi:hypothetical protein
MNFSLSRIIRSLPYFQGGLHFGNYGEDLILHRLFDRTYRNGIYVDLGAYHPFRFSNTAYFYLKGWSGINVDANESSVNLFNRARKNDINIYGAVVPRGYPEKTIKFGSSGKSIDAVGSAVNADTFEQVNIVPAVTIEQILSKLQSPKIDFLNIDLEGMDEQIISEFDFNKYKPQVICIEVYGDNIIDVASSKTALILTANQYIPIARIGPSLIFQIQS